MTNKNLKAVSAFALYTGLLAWGWCTGCSTAPPPSQTVGGATGSGTSNGGVTPPPSAGGSVDSGVLATPVDSGATTPPPKTPKPDSGTAVDAGSGDLQCYGQASDACYNCCVTNHPGGSTIYENAFYDCVCGPPVGTNGVCQSQCAQTDCSETGDAGPVTGDPCDTCENAAVGDAGPCTALVNTACSASADCVAFSNCQDQCP
jgi:hypothetical protein